MQCKRSTSAVPVSYQHGCTSVATALSQCCSGTLPVQCRGSSKSDAGAPTSERHYGRAPLRVHTIPWPRGVPKAPSRGPDSGPTAGAVCAHTWGTEPGHALEAIGARSGRTLGAHTRAHALARARMRARMHDFRSSCACRESACVRAPARPSPDSLAEQGRLEAPEAGAAATGARQAFRCAPEAGPDSGSAPVAVLEVGGRIAPGVQRPRQGARLRAPASWRSAALVEEGECRRHERGVQEPHEVPDFAHLAHGPAVAARRVSGTC